MVHTRLNGLREILHLQTFVWKMMMTMEGSLMNQVMVMMKMIMTDHEDDNEFE